MAGLPSPALMSRIADAIRSVRFGSVRIMIHDARVVHIEKVEKLRLTQEADLTSGGMPRDVGPTNRTTGGSPLPDGR
ncbi:MAG: YezD family protein [Candidatus Omnitrophica bacterium]|nr:YezD family protein [Candidatus Omnitrophota bacterium]